MKKIENFRLGLGVPLTWPYVHSAFLDSMMLLDVPAGYSFVYLRENGGSGSIEALRNHLVEKAFATSCSHLIMLDADMTYPSNTLTQLLSHRLPVVSALIWRRYPPFDPILLKGDLNTYQCIEKWEPNSLLEIDATGTGCILFEMDVFNQIQPPWFEFMPNPDDEKGGTVGEDIAFCWKLRNAGYKIFCDTSVETTHLTVFEVNQKSYELYSAMKKIQARGVITNLSSK